MPRNPFLQEMRLSFDRYDPWGSAMGYLFAIAAVVHVRTGDTPDSWQYRPSPLLGAEILEDDDVDYETIEAREHPTDVLIDAGNVLNRYVAILRRHGRDY